MSSRNSRFGRIANGTGLLPARDGAHMLNSVRLPHRQTEKPKKQLAIVKCTPTLGSVSIQWHVCSEDLFWPNMTSKTVCCVRDRIGNEIAEVRNDIVNRVMMCDKHDTPVSHIFWLDDDVLAMQGCVVELYNQHVPICAGTYFTKLPDGMCSPLIYPDGGGTAEFVPNQIMDVAGCGMGLTLIETQVYKRMARELDLGLDKYGMVKFYHTSEPDELDNMTEDIYFLRNATKLGFKPRVMTTKHAFGFHYQSEIKKIDPVTLEEVIVRRETGFPEEQWKQWIAGSEITWQTKDGPVVWD